MSRKIEMMVERAIVERTVTDLLNDGYFISVDDGEEITLENSTDKAAILAAMFTTDENYLRVHRTGRQHSFVRFIYGNCEDVLSDYGTSLEPIIAPIYDWVNETYA